MEESSWSLFLCQSTDARDSLDRQGLCDGDQTASQGVSPPRRGSLRPGYSRSDVLRQHPACQPRNVLASAAALRQMALYSESPPKRPPPAICPAGISWPIAPVFPLYESVTSAMMLQA